MKKKTLHTLATVFVMAMVAILAIGTTLIAYNGYGTPKVIVEGNYIEAASPTPETPLIQLIQSGDESFGALSSPDIPSPYLTWGGVENVAASMVIKQGTTTPCAFQSPSATSTLVFASISFRTSTSVASTINIAQAATAFATSTAIGTAVAIAAGASATIIASSSPMIATEGVTVFGPNKWLVFGMAGGAYGTSVVGNVPTGFCKVQWIVNSR